MGGGWGGGVVGSLSLTSRGRESLAQFGSIRTDKKMRDGGGCKNWTFFMDVINVWSHTELIIIKHLFNNMYFQISMFIIRTATFITQMACSKYHNNLCKS